MHTLQAFYEVVYSCEVKVKESKRWHESGEHPKFIYDYGMFIEKAIHDVLNRHGEGHSMSYIAIDSKELALLLWDDLKHDSSMY